MFGFVPSASTEDKKDDEVAQTEEEWANSLSELESLRYEVMKLSVDDSKNWFDEGMVNPPKQQGQCGSCWSFSTAAALESAYAIANGKLLSFSEQQLVDCNIKNNGCNGGDITQAFDYTKDHWLMLEDDYPYKGVRQSCPSKYPSEPIGRATSYTYISKNIL
jgi:C1A family cysteine protease